LTRVVFQRGAFDAASTSVTASVLFFFSLGLMGYGGVKILSSAFHAMQDTRTPVKVAILSLIVNALLNVILMFPMKLSGIALASAIASLVNLGILFILLERRIGGLKGAFAEYFAKLFAAGLVMGGFVWASWHFLTGIPEVLRLFCVAVLGGGIYFAGAHAFGLEQARQVLKIFKR
jgi:putative peptidoglycan lipid II flippase